MTEQLSPEMEFAVSCCAWPQTPARADKVRQLARGPLDYALLQRIIKQHEIAGLVQAAIIVSGADLPRDARASLAQEAITHAQDGLKLAVEASRLQDKLDSAG